MSEPVPPTASLSFEHADVPVEAAAISCASCRQPISSTYYGINGQNVCPACRERLVVASGTHGSFSHALLYGAGAAVLGAAAYYAIIALTNTAFGLVAIFVGVFIGKAVRKGAGLRSGRRFRALAVVLAYLSITATYIPQVLESPRVHSLLYASIFSFILPVIMLTGFHNLMGLIILGIGVYEAWKYSAAPTLAVQGPFTLHAPAPAIAVPSTAEPTAAPSAD